MGRRTSGQQVGLQSIGNVQATAATLTTTQNNQDLTLDPNGTGGVVINGDITIADQQDLRLREASANGTNYIALQAAASMASNYTVTWPNAVAGGDGYVLASDTSGNLSWVNAGGNIPVSDAGSTSTVQYPLFGTNAGSIPSTLAPSVKSTLTFIPSSGELAATAFKAPDYYGSTSNSGTITIKGTTSATKATASVLMPDSVASTSTTTGTLVVTGGVGVSGKVNTADLAVTNTPVYPITENAQSSSYTLALTDRNLVVSVSSASATTVTVPPNSSVAFPIGSIVYISRQGAGSVTLAAGAGVSLSKTGTLGANEVISVRKRATDTWIVDDSAYPLSGSGGSTTTSAGITTHSFTSTGSSTLTIS